MATLEKMTQVQLDHWVLFEIERNHRLNRNHDTIKFRIKQGMSLKRLREIYGAWAVNEVLNYDKKFAKR